MEAKPGLPKHVRLNARLGSFTRKPQSIAVRINDNHFAHFPRHILRRLCHFDTVCDETTVALVNVRNLEVDRSAYLTVSRVLSQEDSLFVTSDLKEQRKARLKLVLPVNLETKPMNIERQRLVSADNAKLWDNGLTHLDSFNAA